MSSESEGTPASPELLREMQVLWEKRLASDTTGRMTGDVRNVLKKVFGSRVEANEKLNAEGVKLEWMNQPRVAAEVTKRIAEYMAKARIGFMPFIQEEDKETKKTRELLAVPPSSSFPTGAALSLQKLIADPTSPEADALYWYYSQFVNHGNVTEYIVAFNTANETEAKNASGMLKAQEKYREICRMLESDPSYQSIDDAIKDLNIEESILQKRETHYTDPAQITFHTRAVERLQRELQLLEQKREILTKKKEQLIDKEYELTKAQKKAEHEKFLFAANPSSFEFRRAEAAVDDARNDVTRNGKAIAANDGDLVVANGDISMKQTEISNEEATIAHATNDEQLVTIRSRRKEIKNEINMLDKKKGPTLKLHLQQLDDLLVALEISAGTYPPGIPSQDLNVLTKECDLVAMATAFPAYRSNLKLGDKDQTIGQWVEDAELPAIQKRIIDRFRLMGSDGKPPASLVLDDVIKIRFAESGLTGLEETEKEALYTQTRSTLMSSFKPKGHPSAEDSSSESASGTPAKPLKKRSKLNPLFYTDRLIRVLDAFFESFGV